MNTPETRPDDQTYGVVNINKSSIARFAHECYIHEPGTKKAVDDGKITMLELEIKHYLIAWTNANTPDNIFDENEREKIWKEKLEEAYLITSQIYSIDVSEARRIFEKVSKIPRV